ncbi:MAG: TauD/TfdA family dioxygenase [Gammaproteobacteria bacterium]|nr:TauD/TfdA family dioxygenase [Gammaproteobacteria bacterium]
MSTAAISSDLPKLDIRPMTGALGCEIFGVDLANMDQPTFDAVYQAFLDYSVVVFRDQELEAESFAEFGKRFGKLEEEPFVPNKTDTPGVYYFKGAGGTKKLSSQNLGWHMDHSYQKNPSLGAMLYALDVPETGGDTLFASHYLSYEYLSEPMKEFLADKIGIHDVLHYGIESGHFAISSAEALERLTAMRKSFPQVEHPLICTHPETGRKMLYINKGWTTAIKDLHPRESKAILDMLKEHSLQDRFQCRVRWYNKSVLLWDNRCVQHSPNVDYEDPRIMLRIALHSDWIPA